MSSEKKAVATTGAPAAIGPYSQAIRGGGFLFLSGQIALDPASGVVVGATVAEQTERVLKNIEAVLTAGESSLDRVVKTTVFLKNIGDFPEMNGVYARYFTNTPPARATVEVSRLPKDVLVEIDAIALASTRGE